MKPFLFHFLCLFLGLNAGGAVLTEEQLIAAEQPSALVKSLEKEGKDPRPDLVAMLKSQRLAVRSRALDALEDMAGNNFGFDPWTDPDKADPGPLLSWEAWLKQPSRADNGGQDDTRLYSMILTGTEKTRESACRALLSRKRQALEFLTGYLEKHPELDADTERAIRQARFRIQLDEVTPDAPLLARKLAGSHRNDIIDALEALRKKPVSTLPVIHEFLDHRDPLVREVAVDVFLQNGKKSAVDHIVPLLERETDENVLQIAFRRASDNDDEESRAGLEKLLVRHASSESEDLCLAALKSLSEMKKLQTAIDPEQLLKLFRHPEWRIRHQALQYAGKHRIVQPPLSGKMGEIRAAAVRNGVVQPSSAELLYPRVVEMFRDEDESVRAAAFLVAARMQSPALAPALEQLAFDMPDMAPVILYAMMAGNAELSPAMQAMIKRMPTEKVNVLVRQEDQWDNMLTASDPNDTAKLVIRCLLEHPDPEVKSILAVMEADLLDEDSSPEAWRFVLDRLKDSSVPLETKEKMVSAMSLSYGEIGKLCKLAILGDIKVDPNDSWETQKIKKLKKIQSFGVELVNILRKFSTLEDEEYSGLKGKCIRILLQYGDGEALRSVLTSYRTLSKETRVGIAYRINNEKEFLFSNLPLVKLVAQDEDPEVRERMESFFEKFCEYYSSSKREESGGRKLTILNNSRRNAEMQAFLDEVFTQKYGDQYWTYFLRNFLGSYEISGMFERIPPDKYSIFFPRKYIRGVADDPARSPWQRASAEFALFLQEYPHAVFPPAGADENPVLASLRTFPQDIREIPEWIVQTLSSPDPMARCNAITLLMPVNRIKMALRSPEGELLEGDFPALRRLYEKPYRAGGKPEKASLLPDVLASVSRLAVKDPDLRVRVYASLAQLVASRKCDVDAFCSVLGEVSRKNEELKEQDRYDNEWDKLLDYFQNVFTDRLQNREYEMYENFSAGGTMFAFGPPDPLPGKGKLTEEEGRLFVRVSTEVLKDMYWSSSLTRKYGAAAVPAVMSFASMMPGTEKAALAAEADSVAVRETAGTRPPDPNAPFLVVFFEKSGCDECARVMRDLESLRREYPAMQLETYSITDDRGTEFNALLSSRFRIPQRDRLIAPSVFGAAGGLMRDRLTSGNLKALLEDSRRQPESGIRPDGTRPAWAMMNREAMKQAGKEVRDTYESLSLGVVLLGGLIDGVNPCAFATLIFFLSYLQIARRSPRELLLTGGSFVLSVYLTYFAIGLAFHELIGQLQAWSSLKMVMDVLFSLLALLAAVLSFRDAWLARRGRLADMSLTLPDFLKKRIRRTAREQSKSARFIVAAFAAGIVISALELACTGQVYAPIIYQIRQGSSSAVGMLALYNLAFILPLLLIFFLAYRGMKAESLIRYQQEHAFLVKMLLGFLFLCLTAIIVWGAVR
ncbi:MAG: hypothetical protein LUE13_07865 [Akkermansiaceae bacterium]|nr:hypothetical protein [Akkermansiaceae bacterium]